MLFNRITKSLFSLHLTHTIATFPIIRGIYSAKQRSISAKSAYAFMTYCSQLTVNVMTPLLTPQTDVNQHHQPDVTTTSLTAITHVSARE